MFCSQCGVSAAGKFCWSCGSPLQQAAPIDGDIVPADWTKIIDYEMLLRVPEVRERISRHAARAKKRMSGEQFLDICDKFISPLSNGVSLTAIAALAQPLTEKLGIKTGNARNARFQERPGTMLVAVLCSLAQNEQKLSNVSQASDGCVIEAQLPSDVWALAGELRVALRAERDSTVIDAAVTIKGQYYDWGKSRRALDQMFNEITALARAA